ncbi:MAG: Crp/Fnr family transcriptional regulator [Nevskiales bacterium]|nr:Crp/Fnr family transcriptional regulator [Nevskiales bacterium]
MSPDPGTPAAPRALWSENWSSIVSPELSAALAGLGHRRMLASGEQLYGRGETGTDLIGVVSGLIRIVGITPDGYEGLLGLYRPGSWFGEMSLFDRLPRPGDAVAVGETEVLIVPGQRLLELLDAHPQWYRDFARVLSHKLRMALTHIESTTLPVSARVGLRLLDLAAAYARPADDGVLIDLSLPQEELARMLGLTRQSVNKELRQFQSRGWLQLQRGRITLTDIPALRREVRATGGGAVLDAQGL